MTLNMSSKFTAESRNKSRLPADKTDRHVRRVRKANINKQTNQKKN